LSFHEKFDTDFLPDFLQKIMNCDGEILMQDFSNESSNHPHRLLPIAKIKAEEANFKYFGFIAQHSVLDNSLSLFIASVGTAPLCEITKKVVLEQTEKLKLRHFVTLEKPKLLHIDIPLKVREQKVKPIEKKEPKDFPVSQCKFRSEECSTSWLRTIGLVTDETPICNKVYGRVCAKHPDAKACEHAKQKKPDQTIGFFCDS